MLCKLKVIICLFLAREPLLDYRLPARSLTFHLEVMGLSVLHGKALKCLV